MFLGPGSGLQIFTAKETSCRDGRGPFPTDRLYGDDNDKCANGTKVYTKKRKVSIRWYVKRPHIPTEGKGKELPRKP